jgi:hypothetical protein
VSKNPKYAPQRKTPRYEPPTPKRAPPAITTTSWRKQLPRQVGLFLELKCIYLLEILV